MDDVIRAASVYLVMLVLLRVSGKRNMTQLTAFDFVLLLIISEATQQALLGDDFSITTAFLVIVTLITLNRAFDFLSFRSDTLDQMLNDSAVVIVDDGEVLHDRLKKLRLTPADILLQGRASQGIERIDQIKYAVLERTGSISVIPRRD